MSLLSNKDLTEIALASWAGKAAKIHKGKIEPGEYEVDIVRTVRIKGSIVRSKDTETKATSKIPLKLTLALVLEKSGIMREKIEEILVDSVTEAIKLQEFYKENPDECDESDIETPSDIIGWRLKDIDAAMKRAADMTDKLPLIPKKGQCRWKGIIEDISETKAAAGAVTSDYKVY